MKKVRSVWKKKMTWNEIMNFHLSPGEWKVLDFLAIVDFGRVEEMSLATEVSKSTLEDKYIPELKKLGLVYKYYSGKKEKKTKEKTQLYYISKLGSEKLCTGFVDDKPSEPFLDEQIQMQPPNRGMYPGAHYEHKLLLGEVAAYLIRMKGLEAGRDVRNARKFESETKTSALKVIPDLYLYADNIHKDIEFWEIETNANDTKRLEQKLKKYEKSEEDLLKFFQRQGQRITLVFAMRIEKRQMWMAKFNKAIDNLHYKEFSEPTFNIKFLFLTKDFVNSYEESYKEEAVKQEVEQEQKVAPAYIGRELGIAFTIERWENGYERLSRTLYLDDFLPEKKEKYELELDDIADEEFSSLMYYAYGKPFDSEQVMRVINDLQSPLKEEMKQKLEEERVKCEGKGGIDVEIYVESEKEEIVESPSDTNKDDFGE